MTSSWKSSKSSVTYAMIWFSQILFFTSTLSNTESLSVKHGDSFNKTRRGVYALFYIKYFERNHSSLFSKCTIDILCIFWVHWFVKTPDINTAAQILASTYIPGASFAPSSIAFARTSSCDPLIIIIDRAASFCPPNLTFFQSTNAQPFSHPFYRALQCSFTHPICQ